MDNINFTGGFLLKPTKKFPWRKIGNEIIPDKSSYIKRDMLAKGNVFLATNNRYDREIADYLLDRNIVFTYYPNVDLKSGICKMDFGSAENLVRTSKAITDKKEIKTQVKAMEDLSVPVDYVWKRNDHISQTLSALRTLPYINVDTLTPFTQKGITIFVDRDGKLVAKASANNARGTNYIQVYPRYGDEDMRFLKVNYKNEIHYNTKEIDKLRGFKRDFMAAVNTDLKRPKTTI